MKKEYLDKLAEALCAHMPEKTVLVCGSRAEGKRILSALAAQGHILVGVEAATPFSLAQELCAAELSAPDAPRLIDEVEGAEWIRSCMDENTGIFSGVNAKALSATRAIYRTFQEMMLAGHPVDLTGHPAVTEAPKLQELQKLRMGYAAVKKEKNLLDRGDLFDRALKASAGESALKRAHYVALGDYAPSVLERSLLEKLAEENGLTVVELDCAEEAILPTDALCRKPPQLNAVEELRKSALRLAANSVYPFAACRGVESEVRYVLKDILDKQWQLEDCAVVYLDGSYAQPLYDEAARFDLPVTLGSGLPMTASLLYSTLKRVEAWRQNDFYAEDICDLLESFSCTPMWPAKLAERLRKKKIGWGKARYALACETDDVVDMRAKAMTDEAWESTLASWRKFLRLLLAVAAPTAEREQQKKDVLGFLEFCGHRNPAEGAAYSRAKELVAQIVGLDEHETVLQRLLSLMETSSYLSSKPKPGMLHCAPVSGATCLNRAHVYVTGFARYAVEGTHKESPILLDEERVALGGLKTSVQLRDEQEFRVLTWLTRCGSDLILTYSNFDSDKMLKLEPAPFFEEVSRGIPVKQVTYIPTDTRIAADKLLQEPLRVSYAKPKTWDLADGDAIDLQDKKSRKTLVEEMVLSPTALENGLKCPYFFYLQKMLHIRTPQKVERNNMQWLAPNEMGTFCHSVLEAFYASGQKESWETFFDREFEKLETEIPLPRRSLKEEVRDSLYGMVQRAVQWTADEERTVVAQERSFPKEGEDGLPMTFGKWNLKMKGSIDRVDRLKNGNYAILDYKTGQPKNYTDDLHRHLQHYIYAVAEEQLSKGKETVCEAGYLFLREDPVMLSKLDEDQTLRDETEKRIEWLLDYISDESSEESKDLERAPDFQPSGNQQGGAAANLPVFVRGNRKEAINRCKKTCEFADICPGVKREKKGGK